MQVALKLVSLVWIQRRQHNYYDLGGGGGDMLAFFSTNLGEWVFEILA